jgi:hypothetical protein
MFHVEPCNAISTKRHVSRETRTVSHTEPRCFTWNAVMEPMIGRWQGCFTGNKLARAPTTMLSSFEFLQVESGEANAAPESPLAIPIPQCF